MRGSLACPERSRRNPQIGRFLSVDPLAASGGQDRFSPYAAMGNEPASMMDPKGTMAFGKGPMYFSWAGTAAPDEWGAGLVAMLHEAMARSMGGQGRSASVSGHGGGGSEATQESLTTAELMTFLATAETGVYSVVGGDIVCNYGAGGEGGPEDEDKLVDDEDKKDGNVTSAATVALGTGAIAKEIVTGFGIAVEVTAASVASGLGIIAGVLLPTEIGEGTLPKDLPKTIEEYVDLGKKTFGSQKPWTETVPDPATDFYRPNSKYNKGNKDNKNYFPQGNGSELAKWILRITAGSALYKKFWYDPQHPDSK